MKLNAFWKGLIMAIVGYVSTLIADPEKVSAAYVAISVGGFTLIYVAKNWIMPSVTLFGKIDVMDILSGAIIAVGMAISSFAASIITTGAVDWNALWVAVVGAVVGYFAKTFTTKSK